MDERVFCASCNSEYQPTRKWRKYCSKECQIAGKRKIRKMYKQKLKHITQAPEAQTDINQVIIENIDKQNPSVFDGSDLVEFFSDWQRLACVHGSATGRLLKYEKENDCWFVRICNEIWTLRQWDEWINNCEGQDVSYVLTGAEVNGYCMEKLLSNNTLANFATGGKYCLSHYSIERERFCINVAPPWGHRLISQWQSGEKSFRLAIFFVASGSGTVRFTCSPRKIVNFDTTFRSVVTKYIGNFPSSDINQATQSGDDWKEKLFKELALVGISPSIVEVSPGKGIIIPAEQPFWYEYCQESSASKEGPLVLISGHGDYIGPTTDSFLTKFWGLLESPTKADDALFQIINWCVQVNANMSPTADVHVRAAFHLFANYPLEDKERKQVYGIVERLLNRQPSLSSNVGSFEEDSSLAESSTNPDKSTTNKRKQIDHSSSDQPPLKKFRGGDTSRSNSHDRTEEEIFSAFVANCNLPESMIVLSFDTRKTPPRNLLNSLENKKYVIMPVLDRFSFIIFVDLHDYITEKSKSCNIMYCNSLGQRLKKTDIVNLLSVFTKKKPSWSSIKLTRINEDSVEEDRAILALTKFLELFALKPFANKEEMTKEDKKRWRKSKWPAGFNWTSKLATTEKSESVDTENDDSL